MIEVARACGIVIELVWDRSRRNDTLIGCNVRTVAQKEQA